jgi:hypothetical protein
MITAEFDYVAPDSLDGALAALADGSARAKLEEYIAFARRQGGAGSNAA